MLSRSSIVIRALKPQRSYRLITGTNGGFQCSKYSSVCNQTLGFKTFNRLLIRPCLEKISRRGFKAKGDRPSIKSKPSQNAASKKNLFHPQSIGKVNAQTPTNFWTFAIKIGAYTIGFTALAFSSCAIWQQRNQERVYENRIGERPKRQGNSRSQTDLVYMWNHLSMVNKVTYAIIGLNLLVWGGWKMASQQTMMKWFTLSLNSQKYFINMFLSMFSHKGFIHLYVNMYVLSSFCVAWNRLSTKGHSSANGYERFIAFYLTAGMCSGMLSILIKFLGRIPHPSLGASGAIMGLVGYICEKMPDTRLGIVFIPNWSFSANSAKYSILAFDTVGLLIGAFTNWKYMIFDHAGHLGGILFGIWYARGGDQLLNDFSKFIMRLQQGKR